VRQIPANKLSLGYLIGGNHLLDKKPAIKAIITTNKNLILNSGAPVFLSADQDELQKLSKNLERIMDASAHEINHETIIIVSR